MGLLNAAAKVLARTGPLLEALLRKGWSPSLLACWQHVFPVTVRVTALVCYGLLARFTSAPWEAWSLAGEDHIERLAIQSQQDSKNECQHDGLYSTPVQECHSVTAATTFQPEAITGPAHTGGKGIIQRQEHQEAGLIGSL